MVTVPLSTLQRQAKMKKEAVVLASCDHAAKTVDGSHPANDPMRDDQADRSLVAGSCK